MKKFLPIFSIFCLFFLQTFSQIENNALVKTSSWLAVTSKAKKENKLIFVDCYFTGCHPCAQMDQEVFPNALVAKELADNFISTKVDVFSEKLGDTINMKYAVTGFPTFLIFDSKANLLAMFNGYKDVGQLLVEIQQAKQKALAKESFQGFSDAPINVFPEFYQNYYNRLNNKNTPGVASQWIHQQKDWTQESVALAIFRTRVLDKEIDEFFIKNYAIYKGKYGELLSIEKASSILIAQITASVHNTKNEILFRDFMGIKQHDFPSADWRILNFISGYHYYGTIARDSLALLQFINEQPIAHANYIGSLYNTMLVKKQLNPTYLALLANWSDKAITIESSLDLINMSAIIHKQNNDLVGHDRFLKMANDKKEKYKMVAFK